MRCLDRDRRSCHVARFAGLTREEDAQGRLTGRNVPSHSEPAEFMPTVAPASGAFRGMDFGQLPAFDVSLTVDDPEFEVGEADLLWVGSDPDGPHDHVVLGVYRTPSYTRIAAKRVVS